MQSTLHSVYQHLHFNRFVFDSQCLHRVQCIVNSIYHRIGNTILRGSARVNVHGMQQAVERVCRGFPKRTAVAERYCCNVWCVTNCLA